MTRSFDSPRLVCPETREPLTPADAGLIERLNAAIASGQLKFALGEPAKQPLDGGLIRSDARVLYPVIRGIPHLTLDQAIPLDQVGATD